MLEKIISGFQTGADIAGIDAAIKCGIPYGGWIPKGRRTENGPLDEKYKAVEMPTKGYPPRTKKNVVESDGTVIFTHGTLSGGSSLTRKIATEQGRPWLHVNLTKLSHTEAVDLLLDWIELNKVQILNVAGKSGSKDAKIYQAVRDVLESAILSETV